MGDTSLMLGVGADRTKDNIAELRYERQLLNNLLADGAIGKFGDVNYLSTGLGLNYGPLTVGVDAAYLDSVPTGLTGNLQFKPYIDLGITDNIDLNYTHFSNGSQLFGWDRYPNYGHNFLGVKVKF